MSTTNFCPRGGAVADAPVPRYDPGAMEERVTGVAQVFDLHALKAFAPDKRVRKMLFKTDQLWSEIACYEPGQSTVMHTHPKEEEAIFVLEGTAHMSVDGEEVVVEAGSIVKFPRSVMHDVRNLGPERCVIMFLKVNPRVLSAKTDG
jgi:quercetin dioxygenase-like cupin family protein